ncbi:hypothetical protein BCT27_19020 [Enterovibrio norvegicus]|nr:hypothetical protein BCT27_19020 [Enterovibrio norvegicus]
MIKLYSVTLLEFTSEWHVVIEADAILNVRVILFENVLSVRQKTRVVKVWLQLWLKTRNARDFSTEYLRKS